VRHGEGPKEQCLDTQKGTKIMRSISTGALVVVMSLVFTFGCATGRAAYAKPGTTPEDRKRDVSDCALASLGHQPERHVLTPIMVDRAAFEKCLEGRGYSRVR
jgi:hypothetical protein